MLKVQNLTVHAGNTPLLKNVSFELPPGELVAVMGPNGAGKSTLLKTLSGEWLASQGDVEMNQVPIASLSALKLAQMRAVMPQKIEVDFPFQVSEILDMAFDVSTRPHDKSALIEQIMAWFDLSKLYARNYLTLSGGEQQRVNLARVILQLWSRRKAQSQWLLLDECTSSLDLNHQHLVFQRLQLLAKEFGVGVVMVLHDLNLASQYAHQTLLLKEGKLHALGATAQVLQPKVLSEVFAFETRCLSHPQGWPIIVPA